MIAPLLVAVVLASTTLAPSQALTWVEGSSATSLALQTVPEANPAAAPTTLLANLEILPIEITGRTLQQELDPTRSRRLSREGLTRVELPGGGRVLAYRRGAGQFYGYLLVLGNGTASVLLEQPGLAGQSPFIDRIGVSGDGNWGVACSAARTRLYFMRLDGTVFTSTGTPTRAVTLPAPAEATSIMAGRSHVFLACDDERMRRCALADGGQLEEVGPPPIAGARLKSELALSGDGRHAVFLYGVQPQFALWMVGENGPPRRLPPPIAHYEEPGYLPETSGGPRLLLNHDGSRLMYTDADDRDEIYLSDTTGATATTHVTGDHNFVPYIGIGIFPTFSASLLVLGVGEFDRYDVFAASSGEQPVVNLTGTNNNLTRPFHAGSLEPENIVSTLGGTVLIADRPLGGALRLLRADPLSFNSVVIADQLDRLPWLAAASTAVPDILVSSASGDRLLEGTAATTTLLAAPAGIDVHNDVLLSTSWRVLSVGTAALSAIVFRAPDGTLLALPASAGGQRAYVTAAENFVIDGTTLVHVSPTHGAVTVATSGAPRKLLSGLGL